MDDRELRALQAPSRTATKKTPKPLSSPLRAQGALGSQKIACKVETGRALAVAGLHPATGGTDTELYVLATCCSKLSSLAPA